jgi:hypothetical protein
MHIMKIKTLCLALTIAMVSPLIYAESTRVPLDTHNITPKAMEGRSIDEIVAFAAENSQFLQAIALNAILAAENPEQATLIARALAAKFPNNAVMIRHELIRAAMEIDHEHGSTHHKIWYSEAQINPTQDLANNIQAAANQGRITQQTANLLIAGIVLRSRGSTIAPPRPPSPS